MNQLPSKTTLQMIQAMESGEISHLEAGARLAKINLARQDPYTKTLVGGLLLVGLAWTMTGGSVIIPAAIALLTFEHFTTARNNRLASFQAISRGDFLEYLPESDRALFAEPAPPDVPESPAPEATPPKEPENPIHPQIQNIIVGDIALSLAHTFKPTIISARPRVGKGIIVSHAIAHAKPKYGLSVWVLQPKPAPTELAYWKHADRFLGINLEDHPRDCPIVAEQMTEFFMTWRAQPHRPTMLLIDEIVKIQAMQPKWYKDFLIPQCIVEASSGETDERFLYLITVSPLVGDLGMSGGNRSSFDFMAIEKAETTDHIESIKQSVKSIKAIPTEADFQISPIGSLIYHTALGRWAAVPRYDLPTIAPSDVLCPELEALARPKPAYAVVSSGPNYSPVEIEPELPAWMQAVAASAVTSAFYQPTGDPIEFAIMNYFRNRPHQPKAARDILAAKIKALEGMRSGEIRDYLECLASEGKLIQDGQSFQFAG